MFDFEEFIAKTELYFQRGAEIEEAPEGRAVWLLLGLEFLLRAPLAKVHPALLAAPEGDSILHAVGVERARGLPKSIPIKAVIDRLTKIDPNFGEDRGKDAAFVTELRNEELHSSSATLANAGEAVWMPPFLNVVEAVCAHLDIGVGDLLDEDLVQAAETYRATADKATQGIVTKLGKEARTRFEGLTPAEIATRASNPGPFKGGMKIECPVCGEDAAWLSLSEGRATPPKYDEEDQVINYKIVRVVNALHCNVCGLDLSGTAQVIAVGVDRLHDTEYTEERYEGWQELMTYEDAMDVIGVGEDYGND